ncbi:MAG: HAD family phosphatase [Spirochaetales bacterium]|nr:HAD family phosphatase [Spirochaetales bacterium]
MIKAAIFDFDGTLVDSEDNYYLADKTLIESKSNAVFTKADKEEFIGLDGKEVIRRIKDKYHLRGTVEQLLEQKNSLYLRIALQNTKVYPKMLHLVQMFQSHNIPMAVASGTYNDNLHKLLEATNLKQYFKVILGGDDVPLGKPDPAIFLTAAAKLGIDPHNCVVIEDSLHGVEAALAAGMHIIAVPYLIKPHYEDEFYRCDFLSESGMDGFEPEEAFKQIL